VRATVSSFADLLAHPLRDGVNAVSWPRALAGDFAEVARALAPREGYVDVDAAALRSLRLSGAGRAAADAIVADLRALEDRDPALSCIASYARDERGLAIAADAMSFHADRSPIEIETFLCTYVGKPSEGLDNAHARKLLDDPAVRAAIAASGAHDEAFDLHYAAVGGAAPWSFGVGALWKIAVEWPGCPVPPCLHRAPAIAPGAAPRLLLIC
jgi:hypothetical protein